MQGAKYAEYGATLQGDSRAAELGNALPAQTFKDRATPTADLYDMTPGQKIGAQAVGFALGAESIAGVANFGVTEGPLVAKRFSRFAFDARTDIEAIGVPGSTPAGVTYEGSLYRAVPSGGDPLEISYSIAADGRYTEPGQGGLYFASNARTVEAEFVNNGYSLVGRDLNIFGNSTADNLLDLSDPVVREGLGVSLSDLTRTGGTPAWRYEVTHPLGRFAQSQGYNGIIAPSAQADGGVNIILFSAKDLK